MAKPLLVGQPVTANGDRGSLELYEVIATLVRDVQTLQGKLAAIGAIVAPSSGATVDAEARTAIAAIIAASG